MPLLTRTLLLTLLLVACTLLITACGGEDRRKAASPTSAEAFAEREEERASDEGPDADGDDDDPAETVPTTPIEPVDGATRPGVEGEVEAAYLRFAGFLAAGDGAAACAMGTEAYQLRVVDTWAGAGASDVPAGQLDCATAVEESSSLAAGQGIDPAARRVLEVAVDGDGSSARLEVGAGTTPDEVVTMTKVADEWLLAASAPAASPPAAADGASG